MANSHTPTKSSLLGPDEPHPLEVVNETGPSPFFLICEHAGKRIPASLGTLGLSEVDRARHIAWDIGARAVAIELSRLLDAPLYMQRYSRLVCDCNRKPGTDTFIPELSEATTIPGNLALDDEDRDARAQEIFWPFHDPIARVLDDRLQRGQPTRLVTIHSFTPVFLGQRRPWEIGVLFKNDRDFAPAIADWLQRNTGHCIGVNEPYAISDDTDYAIIVHGEQRGLASVEFEVRNDLIEDEGDVPGWAEVLESVLVANGSEG